MNSGPPNPLSAALDQLWAKFLPQMEERLAVMDAANRSLAAGTLTAEERAAAGAAAHKLAGVLGTFGLAEGTALAREAELTYAGDAALQGNAARLEEIARQLNAMIRNRR